MVNTIWRFVSGSYPKTTVCINIQSQMKRSGTKSCCSNFTHEGIIRLKTVNFLAGLVSEKFYVST